MTTHRFNAASYPVQLIDALGQKTTYERAIGTNALLSTTDSAGPGHALHLRCERERPDDHRSPGEPPTYTYEPTFNKVTSATDPLDT